MTALPHNLEAEQALLGALMFDNALLEKLPALTAADFYDPVHGRIFAAITSLIGAGRFADGVTLAERLAGDVGLTELGGRAYLMRLMDAAAPLTYQAVDYAHLLRDLSARRLLVAIADQLRAGALSRAGDEDVVDVALGAERALQAIGASGNAREIGLREAGQRVVDNLSKPYRGLSTGIGELDKLIGGLVAPDLIILAGRPGMGKTSLAVNIAVNVARGAVVDEHGKPIRPRVVAFFSMEMSAEQLAGRALARRSKASGAMAFGYNQLYAREFRPKPDTVEPFLSWLPDALRIDDGAAQTTAAIRATCRDIRSRYSALDLVCVDYLQLAVDPAARRDGRVQEVTAITAALKGLAKDMNVPVLALSQLSRQVEGRLDKLPQNSDLRESGSIEQDADVIVFAYREHYYLSQNEPRRRDGEEKFDFEQRERAWRDRKTATANTFTAICGKRRNGPVGVAELYCDLAHDLIADPEHTAPQIEKPTPYWER